MKTASDARFTMDGSDPLEMRLAEGCRTILAGVQEIIPVAQLEGLVLGGGYGRGQGGVLMTDDGAQPYNDLEFYVFVRGSLLMAEMRHRSGLRALGERLSPAMGLHVEFKLDSIKKLRRSKITMYSYDLVSGHKIIIGDRSLFQGCEHHHDAGQIPASEATRLLFNRCSGLLLVRDLFRKPELNREDLDFIGRNLAKAQLGFGDALLTIFGHYHWNCCERHERLLKLKPQDAPSWFEEVRNHHAEGVDFKLHPRRAINPRNELESRFARLHELGRQLWLWVESRRLNHPFDSVRDYALSDLLKCPESVPGRNCLLNLKTYGPQAPFVGGFFRYPREQLFNALCFLLWDEASADEPSILSRLRNHLRARSARWEDLVPAYQRLWQNYG